MPGLCGTSLSPLTPNKPHSAIRHERFLDLPRYKSDFASPPSPRTFTPLITAVAGSCSTLLAAGSGMPRRRQQWGAKAPVDFVSEILCDCDGNEGGGAGDNHDPPPGEITLFKSKNLQTERRRRAKLKHQFFTLRSLVPRITKMSKEATLADAVDYIHDLRRQKEDLQKELQEIADEDAEKQGSASTTGAMASVPPDPVHCKEDVEVSVLGKNKLRASVVCRNKRGGFTKVVEAVGSLGLEVTDANLLTLGGVSQVMLCMEAREEERVVAGEKVRLLRDLLLRVI